MDHTGGSHKMQREATVDLAAISEVARGASRMLTDRLYARAEAALCILGLVRGTAARAFLAGCAHRLAGMRTLEPPAFHLAHRAPAAEPVNRSVACHID